MILCSRYRKRIDALIEHRVAMQSFIQSVSSKSGATMQQSLGIIAMRHTSSAVQCSAVQFRSTSIFRIPCNTCTTV
jgi:hypothetical protein